MRECEEDLAMAWVHKSLSNLNVSTTAISLVSHTLKLLSEDEEVKMPVSWGYHCTLDTAKEMLEEEELAAEELRVEETACAWTKIA